MNTYIFTFGIGHEFKNRYQPITANDSDEARNKMVQIYGTNWSSVYTEEEFEQSKEKGFFKNLSPFETIKSMEVAQ